MLTTCHPHTTFLVSLSILTAIFPDGPALRMMKMVLTSGAIRRAKLQSNHHHQQTNTQHFTGRMPFLSPNQQCQSTEGRTSHSTDLFTPSSPGRLTTLSLTIKGSWLPWAGLPCPLTPAPPKSSIICPTNNYTRSHSNTMRYAVR